MQDLYDHYRHASSTTKKLNFLGSYNEQLPCPLWDPEVWTDARLLGPADIRKLVYVATDQHKQQQVVKFTKQYGWDVHRTWGERRALWLQHCLLPRHQAPPARSRQRSERKRPEIEEYTLDQSFSS